MTGFANARGEGHGHDWRWELRSVNGRGLDLRLRVPDWIDGLEAQARKSLGAAFSRGSITASLRASQSGADAGGDSLGWALARLAEVEARAAETGISLVPASATDILAMRPEPAEAPQDMELLRAAAIATLDEAIAELRAAREAEGIALRGIVNEQLDEIESLTRAAREAEGRAAEQRRAALRAAMARVLEAATVDEGRLEQELALIAVKADIAEELDRLGAHVEAGRALLAESGPVGRKLDFLTQEFNREANTLCSKSSSRELTDIGLSLKAVVDRMREQVQNVE